MCSRLPALSLWTLVKLGRGHRKLSPRGACCRLMVKEPPPARRGPHPAPGGHIHTHKHTHSARASQPQEGSLSLTVGGTGQVCSQGPFLESGLERISQQTGLLPSCSMSCRPRATPACGGVCPFCRGGSTAEPQARAQSWSQLFPMSPLKGGPRVAPLLLGACPPLVEHTQVRSPVMWPPRAMRRGLVKVSLTRGRDARALWWEAGGCRVRPGFSLCPCFSPRPWTSLRFPIC